MEKNLKEKSPKKKTAEKNKKTKKKKIERTPRGGGTAVFGFKLSRMFIYFVFVAKCKRKKKQRLKSPLK